MNLSKNHKWIIGIGLMLLMILTRSHHFANTSQLPDASWAVFFLAAIYLRSLWLFPVFMLVAWLSDLAAVKYAGVSDFCITPGYFTLVAAYGALWLAGFWYAHQHKDTWSTLSPLCISFLAGMFLCEIFSSGGFYLFSGYFSDPNLNEFVMRVIKYFPGFFMSAMMYIAIAMGLHLSVRLVVYQSGEVKA